MSAPTTTQSDAPQTAKQIAHLFFEADRLQPIPDGYCKFEGRLIPLTHIPERAWPSGVFDIKTGSPTGETIGDLVQRARRQR